MENIELGLKLEATTVKFEQRVKNIEDFRKDLEMLCYSYTAKLVHLNRYSAIFIMNEDYPQNAYELAEEIKDFVE